MNKTAVIIAAAALTGTAIWIVTLAQKASAEPKPPTPSIPTPSWIPTISGISSADKVALSTYPANPPFGKYILVGSVTTQTWVSPSDLAAFIAPIGQWKVLPYPY